MEFFLRQPILRNPNSASYQHSHQHKPPQPTWNFHGVGDTRGSKEGTLTSLSTFDAFEPQLTGPTEMSGNPWDYITLQYGGGPSKSQGSDTCSDIGRISPLDLGPPMFCANQAVDFMQSPPRSRPHQIHSRAPTFARAQQSHHGVSSADPFPRAPGAPPRDVTPRIYDHRSTSPFASTPPPPPYLTNTAPLGVRSVRAVQPYVIERSSSHASMAPFTPQRSIERSYFIMQPSFSGRQPYSQQPDTNRMQASSSHDCEHAPSFDRARPMQLQPFSHTLAQRLKVAHHMPGSCESSDQSALRPRYVPNPVATAPSLQAVTSSFAEMMSNRIAGENSSENSVENIPAHGAYFKTAVCRYYSLGRTCPKGDACTYAHGQQELRTFKTALCREFAATQTCARGQSCTYAHGLEDMRGRGSLSTSVARASSLPLPEAERAISAINAMGDGQRERLHTHVVEVLQFHAEAILRLEQSSRSKQRGGHNTWPRSPTTVLHGNNRLRRTVRGGGAFLGASQLCNTLRAICGGHGTDFGFDLTIQNIMAFALQFPASFLVDLRANTIALKSITRS